MTVQATCFSVTLVVVISNFDGIAGKHVPMFFKLRRDSADIYYGLIAQNSEPRQGAANLHVLYACGRPQPGNYITAHITTKCSWHRSA